MNSTHCSGFSHIKIVQNMPFLMD